MLKDMSITYNNQLITYTLLKFCFQTIDENNILKNLQHGFRSGYSCTTQLLTLIEELAKGMDNRKQIDALFLDYAKAFDIVSYQ